MNLIGLYGQCMSLIILYGQCMSLIGLYGQCMSLIGLYGQCMSLIGLYGQCMSLIGLYGQFTVCSAVTDVDVLQVTAPHQHMLIKPILGLVITSRKCWNLINTRTHIIRHVITSMKCWTLNTVHASSRSTLLFLFGRISSH